ncbi:MAG TPA: site-2 protease family protein [Clostridia bacterium]|nr:site-2 protease family protein [Clostridia bacterium]
MDLRVVYIFFQVVAFLFAISVHESAHAWTASRLGDPTARMLGRVSLNPLKHIDIIGTVILPVFAAITGLPMFGWAKPTPVDPRNFKHPRRDDILTSIAGPISNFLVVLGCLVVMAVIANTSAAGEAVVHGLATFGLGGIVDAGGLTPLALMFYLLMLVNVWLGIFNLIPIPPLDGSHVIRHMLPDGIREIYDRSGMIALMLLVFFGGRLLGALASPAIAVLRMILASV